MYLTPRHICFFAHMPDKEVKSRPIFSVSELTNQNLIVKTGPLSKKASRTKLNTKFWAVLRNDVLSWYESTAVSFPSSPLELQADV